MYLYAYNQGSESAASLLEELDIYRIKHRNSAFKGAPGKTVINWGSGSLPDEVLRCRVLNHPNAVNLASDKLRFFTRIRDAGHQDIIPQFYTSRRDASVAVADGQTLVARTVLRGHSGEGIVIVRNMDEMVDAPLYTRYIKKLHEYRIHVFQGRVIDVQRKALRQEFQGRDDVNWVVRNHANGFIYARDGVEAPADAMSKAILAVADVGLDFGAVDVIWNNQQSCAYVLEVNTAPGLSGQTVINYANAFRGIQ